MIFGENAVREQTQKRTNNDYYLTLHQQIRYAYSKYMTTQSPCLGSISITRLPRRTCHKERDYAFTYKVLCRT